MSRLMSVAMTVDAVIERRKTVSRRLNWWEDKRGRRLLKPGDHVTLCRKVMGRTSPPLARLAEVEVLDVRRERLWAGLSDEEVTLEGFPDWGRLDFFLFFRDSILPRDPEPEHRFVTRIEWRYVCGSGFCECGGCAL